MMFLLIVTVSSIALAVVMGAIAWRLAAEERRRSEARVAALRAEIHAPASFAASAAQRGGRRAEVGIRGEPPRITPAPIVRPIIRRWDDELELHPGSSESRDELFSRTREPANRRPFVVAALGIALFAVVALVALVGLPRHNQSTAVAGASQPSAGDNRQAAATRTDMPLDLVALGHERDGDRLIVRGVVRNPPSGTAFDEVTAVVFAFNADGGFVASGRAALETRALGPAGESTFVVTVPDAGSAARYRVSFRSGDRIVPHLDRRGDTQKRS
jgi:hypothetical protein